MRWLVLVLACQVENADPPRKTIVLWAWDRAEDFRFLKPSQAEVAALMATVQLRDGQANTRWRALPLRLPDGVRLLPVVRLEAAKGTQFPQVSAVLDVLRNVNARTGAKTIQLDFDARQSEWTWYRELLDAAKQRLGVRTSATALLASCFAKGPLDPQPASLDEAVPMLFRMGREAPRWLETVRKQGVASGCKRAIGISTDEPAGWGFAQSVPRVYVFHPKPWTKEAFYRACETLRSAR